MIRFLLKKSSTVFSENTLIFEIIGSIIALFIVFKILKPSYKKAMKEWRQLDASVSTLEIVGILCMAFGCALIPVFTFRELRYIDFWHLIKILLVGATPFLLGWRLKWIGRSNIIRKELDKLIEDSEKQLKLERSYEARDSYLRAECLFALQASIPKYQIKESNDNYSVKARKEELEQRLQEFCDTRHKQQEKTFNDIYCKINKLPSFLKIRLLPKSEDETFRVGDDSRFPLTIPASKALRPFEVQEFWNQAQYRLNNAPKIVSNQQIEQLKYLCAKRIEILKQASESVEISSYEQFLPMYCQTRDAQIQNRYPRIDHILNITLPLPFSTFENQYDEQTLDSIAINLGENISGDMFIGALITYLFTNHSEYILGSVPNYYLMNDREKFLFVGKSVANGFTGEKEIAYAIVKFSFANYSLNGYRISYGCCPYPEVDSNGEFQALHYVLGQQIGTYSQVKVWNYVKGEWEQHERPDYYHIPEFATSTEMEARDIANTVQSAFKYISNHPQEIFGT